MEAESKSSLKKGPAGKEGHSEERQLNPSRKAHSSIKCGSLVVGSREQKNKSFLKVIPKAYPVKQISAFRFENHPEKKIFFSVFLDRISL